MIARVFGSMLAAAGLALAPLASGATLLVVPSCSGASHLLVLPHDPAVPVDRGGGCAKACHAMTDRRARSPAGRKSCC
ncbi:hypothetical protein [Sphingopyxis panaciterrae]